MTINDWSTMTGEEKDAIIRPAWESGASAGEIAAMFSGATRNMIIGRVTRGKMGSRPATRTKASYAKSAEHATKAMGKRQRELKLKTAPKPKVARKPIPAQPGSPPLVQRIPEPDIAPASVLHMINNERPPLAGTTPVDILSLPNRPGVLCRFPVVGGLYCGAACGENMYCPDHKAIMYRPAERLRVPKEARR